MTRMPAIPDHGACRGAAVAGLLALSVLTLASAGWSQKPQVARTLHDLGGVNSFSPRLENVADLQRLFEESRADFLTVLSKAGWRDEAEDLLRAVAAGEVIESTFPIGDRLQWMAYRTPAKVDVIRNVLWQGKEPFEAFEIRIESKGRRSTFVVPKACGNLSLYSRVGTSELTVSVTSGLIELIDAQGQEISLRAGESATVTAPGHLAEGPAGEVGRRSWIDVEEGDVEFNDYRGGVTVFLEAENTLGATVQPDQQLTLEVPVTNPAPLRAQFGDAGAKIHPGTSAGVDWPTPECALEVSPRSDCIDRPFTLDAGSSAVRPGVVRTVELELVHPDGRTETLVPDRPGLFRWTRSFGALGSYRVSAVAVSNKGKRSRNVCAATFQVTTCEPPRPQPPTAALAISAADVDPFAELGIDASGSRSEGGEVVKVEIVVTGPDGETVAEMELEPRFTARLTLDRGGVHPVRAVAVDDHGQRSAAAEAQVDVYPRSSFAGWVLPGYERRRAGESDRSSPVVGFKGGWRRILSRREEFAVSLGGVLNTRVSGDSSLFVDVELNWRLGKGFVGVGAGLWDLGDPEADVLVHGGRELPFKLGRRPAYWVLEGRLFPDELDDSFVLLGGLRFFSP